MRYCPTCDAEYVDDSRKTCPEDGATLLDREAWDAERSRSGRKPLEIRRLVTIARMADRFKAEELARALAEEGFDVSLAADKGGTVGPLTTPGPALFTLNVSEDVAERAAALVDEWRSGLEASTEEAAAAAEAEEAASEAATSEPNPA